MAPKRPTKTSARGRQEHPKGPLLTVDDSFVEQVQAELTKRGWDQKQFAEEISISEGAISRLMQPGTKQIRFKPRIQEFFGWKIDERGEKAIRQIMDKAPLLDADDAETVAALINSLAAKRRSPTT